MPCVQDAITPGDVLDQVDGGEQLVALAVGLHHRVLDAVVDHLAEVAGADRAGVHEARVAGVLLPGLVLGDRRLEGVEDRLHLGDVVLAAADHQRVAVLQAPDAAGDAGVDVADALLAQHHVVHLVVGELRVAAVDDDVALAEQLAELARPSPGSGRPTGTITQTTRGRLERLDQRLQAVDVPLARRCGRSRRPRGRRGAAARPCCRPSCPARSAPAARCRSSLGASCDRLSIVPCASGRERAGSGAVQPGRRTGMIR